MKWPPVESYRREVPPVEVASMSSVGAFELHVYGVA